MDYLKDKDDTDDLILKPLNIVQLLQENDLLLSAASTNLSLNRVHSSLTFERLVA